jgi:hypothetical protein
VTDLHWRESPDGYQSAGYRILRPEGTSRPQWRLERIDGMAPVVTARSPTISFHHSLQEAIGMAASLAYIAVSSTTLALSPAGFVAAMALFYVAVASFVDAIEAWSWDGWGWDERVSKGLRWSDRRLLGLVERWRRRSLAAANADPLPAVLTLPPKQFR